MNRAQNNRVKLVRRLGSVLAVTALTVLAIAPSAQAAFGFEDFDLTFTNANGSTATQAGAHPFAVTNTLHFNTVAEPGFGQIPDQAVKDVDVQLPEGLVGEPGATPRCSGPDFIDFNNETKLPKCSDSTAVGTALVKVKGALGDPELFGFISSPVYNLIPPPGVVQKLGFIAFGVPVVIEFTINPNPPYNILARPHNISQALLIQGSQLTIWGNPASPLHDLERGSCVNAHNPIPEEELQTSGEKCPTNIAERPFITLPRACTGPLATTYTADSWQNPGAWTPPAFVLTHDNATPPNPQGLSGCDKLGFNPTIAAKADDQSGSVADRLGLQPRRPRRRPDQLERFGQLRHPQSRGHPARGLHHQPLAGRRPEHLL
jgi:hypothetical protein